MFGFLKNKKAEYKASVNSGVEELTVKPSQNLLAAALEAGLNWPHDCRVGSCGTCRCTLKEGKIKPLSDFSYVLTGDQIKSGMILACQTSLRSDIVVEVEMDESAKRVEVTTHAGVLKHTTRLTHDIFELVIGFNDEFPRTAVAGQYAEVSTPSISQPRSYSFAKAPENETPGEVTFFVRHVPGGEFTDWLFAEDRTGEPMSVKGPFGSFWLRPDEIPMVCIAGGSGISSIKAMLENACNVNVQRDCLFLFGARAQADVYCQKAMAEIKQKWHKDFSFEFVPVLSNEPEDSDWQGPRGFVTDHLRKEYVENGIIDLKNAQGYLCGPPPMIDAGVDVMKAEGMPEANIFFDKFLDASSMPGGRK